MLDKKKLITRDENKTKNYSYYVIYKRSKINFDYKLL